MRFPWLQMDSDFLEAAAGDLGVLLGISRREAVGMMADLWAWCLTRTPKDRAPDGVVAGTGAVSLLTAAAEWTGEPELLLAALEQVGVLERLEDGFRFRGMGRYRSTWEKNRRRKPNRQKTGAEPERNRSASPRKTQTQTQTQNEEDLPGSESRPPVSDNSAHIVGLKAFLDAEGVPEVHPEDEAAVERLQEQVLPVSAGSGNHPKIPESSPLPAAAMPSKGSGMARQSANDETPVPPMPERAELRLVSPKAARTRKPSAAERLYAKLEETRKARCEERGVAFVPEDWAPARQNTSLGSFAKLTQEAEERFTAAWAEYLADERGAAKDPPWSIGFFLTSKSTWESKALRGAS